MHTPTAQQKHCRDAAAFQRHTLTNYPVSPTVMTAVVTACLLLRLQQPQITYVAAAPQVRQVQVHKHNSLDCCLCLLAYSFFALLP
jgi:hypothetical protein